MISCMATKTISLELDAYEKLKIAKRSERESFSEVVRRAVFPAAPHTGASVLETLAKTTDTDLPSNTVFEYLEAADNEDRRKPRISRSRWEGSSAT